MSKVKSPKQKKALSLERDRRNVYESSLAFATGKRCAQASKARCASRMERAILKDVLQNARRWCDCDETLTRREIAQTLRLLRSMGSELTSVGTSLACAIVDFYSENSTPKSDPRPIRMLLEHRAPVVELMARKRLVLNFYDASAAYPVIERLRAGKAEEEDLMCFKFILACALMRPEGDEIVRKIAAFLREHPLPPDVKSDVTLDLLSQGFHPARLF